MDNNLKDLVLKTQKKWADYVLEISNAHKKNENLSSTFCKSVINLARLHNYNNTREKIRTESNTY